MLLEGKGRKQRFRGRGFREQSSQRTSCWDDKPGEKKKHLLLESQSLPETSKV